MFLKTKLSKVQSKDLRIELETEQQALDETVVIAYGTQQKGVRGCFSFFGDEPRTS